MDRKFNLIMKNLQDYIEDFKSLWNGKFWASENYVKTFKEITPAQATCKPIPDLHSVAELVWHVAAWRKVMIVHLQGDNSYDIELNSKDDWKQIDEGDEVAWENAIKELQETQNLILDLLKNADESTLDATYKKKYNRAFLINGVIQHDIYHLGQIRMMLAIARAKSSTQRNTENIND